MMTGHWVGEWYIPPQWEHSRWALSLLTPIVGLLVKYLLMCAWRLDPVTCNNTYIATPVTTHIVWHLWHHIWCDDHDYNTTWHDNTYCDHTIILTMTQHGTMTPTIAMQQMQLQYNAHHSHATTAPATQNVVWWHPLQPYNKCSMMTPTIAIQQMQLQHDAHYSHTMTVPMTQNAAQWHPLWPCNKCNHNMTPTIATQQQYPWTKHSAMIVPTI